MDVEFTELHFPVEYSPGPIESFQVLLQRLVGEDVDVVILEIWSEFLSRN